MQAAETELDEKDMQEVDYKNLFTEVSLLPLFLPFSLPFMPVLTACKSRERDCTTFQTHWQKFSVVSQISIGTALRATLGSDFVAHFLICTSVMKPRNKGT